MSDGVGIRVSQHALVRFRQRCPDAAVRDPMATVFYEVRSALTAQRRALKPPAWAYIGRRRKPRNQAKVRYVWNEAETRCYALLSGKVGADERELGYRQVWVVMTTLERKNEKGPA